MKPRLFVGSSVERLALAYAVQENLEHSLEVTVWSQGVFDLSRTAMAGLLDTVAESDFAVFVFAPDDVTRLRDKTLHSVRDNVVFELGLFMGALGPERCFMITPRGVDDLHLPTDLAGLTPATYEPERQDGNMIAALGPACNRVRRAAEKLGKAQPIVLPPCPTDSPAADLCDDSNDCIALIQSWMGQRARGANTSAIRYDEVDRDLRLAPGSAKLYIAEAARRWNYVPDRQGANTVLFKSIDD